MSDIRQQRIDTLKAAARRKSEQKTKDTEAAIRRLIKREEPVTFQSVRREAGVSQNFLYKNAKLSPGSSIRGARTVRPHQPRAPTKTVTTTLSSLSPPRSPG